MQPDQNQPVQNPTQPIAPTTQPQPVPSQINPQPPIMPATVIPDPTTLAAPAPGKFNLKLIAIIITVFVLLLAGGGGTYYYFNFIQIPKAVKASVVKIQPAFEDYSKTIKEISKDLESVNVTGTPGLTALTYANLIDDEESKNKTLASGLSQAKTKQIQPYKKSVEEYMVKAKESATIEKDIVNMTNSYEEPMQKYQNVEILSQQILQQSTMDMNTLNEIITLEQEVVQSLESLSFQTPEVQKIHEIQVQSFKDELTFLKEIQRAGGDPAGVAAGLETYLQQSEKSSSDVAEQGNRLMNKIKSLSDSLNLLENNVQKEYEKLQKKYKL